MTMIVKTVMETKVRLLALHFVDLFLEVIPTGFRPVTIREEEDIGVVVHLLEKTMQVLGITMTHQRMLFTGKIVRTPTPITGLLMKIPVLGIGQDKEKINGRYTAQGSGHSRTLFKDA